jgi:hypothetical protein
MVIMIVIKLNMRLKCNQNIIKWHKQHIEVFFVKVIEMVTNAWEKDIK